MPAELAALLVAGANVHPAGGNHRLRARRASALPPDLVPWRTPDYPVCVHNEYGRAWEVVRLGDPPRRWKMRRPADDQPQ